MAIYKRDIANINLETGNIHRTFLNHSIGYMDQKADHFGIRVFRNGEPVDLTGVSVQGVFMPPQGSPIAITGSTYTIVSGNTAEVILPQACYNYDGQFTLAIKLVDSTNSVTGTMRIVDGMVDNTHASGTVAPTSAVPTYQEILSTYDAMVAATAAANGAIAPLYANLTFPVKAGQYTIVDGALKRAIVDIATSEAYTAAHWTNAKLGPDLSDVKNALNEFYIIENATNVTGWEQGYYKVANGTKGNGNDYCRTINGILIGGRRAKLTIADGLACSCFEYSTSALSSYIQRIFMSKTGTFEWTFSEGKYYRFHVAKIDGSNILVADLPDPVISYAIMDKTDTSLTISDFAADAKATGDAIGELWNTLSENTVNLWTYGDLSGTKYVRKNFNFVSGKTYTISCKITSSYTGENQNSRIAIDDSEFHEKVVKTIKHDGTRRSCTFTAIDNCTKILIFAANTSEESTGHTVSATDIQIEEGGTMTAYVPPVTATDYVARASIIPDTVELLSNKTYNGSDADTFEIPETDISLGIPVVYCEAMFTRTSGVTDYPRIRMEMTNARDLTRFSIYYKVGSEGQYASHEWRTPAFLWGKKSTTIRLVVPAGCSLTIRKMGYRYENCVDRTNARGINFFARPGTCNMVPELSEPAVQMALRHGYDTFTVIPKISSDGVWFCYHDDRWVETGNDKTYMVNADGSAITEDQYNNLQFHQIPFEGYLDQFVTGTFGSTFYTTKLMKLEDCCAILAKTGMKLRFSMHPSAGVNDHLASLKRLVQKYGLLKDLSIIVNDISALFTAFGNDIGCYCFPNATGSSWESGAVKPVNSGFVAAQAAKTTYGITVPINCGLWVDSLFADMDKAEQLVSDILDEGFTAGAIAGVAHDTIDGATRTGNETIQLWSEDVRWLMSIGVTEITEGNNTSLGLDW